MSSLEMYNLCLWMRKLLMVKITFAVHGLAEMIFAFLSSYLLSEFRTCALKVSINQSLWPYEEGCRMVNICRGSFLIATGSGDVAERSWKFV